MPSGLWEMGVGRETRCLRDTSAQEVSPGHRDSGGLGSSSHRLFQSTHFLFQKILGSGAARSTNPIRGLGARVGAQGICAPHLPNPWKPGLHWEPPETQEVPGGGTVPGETKLAVSPQGSSPSPQPPLNGNQMRPSPHPGRLLQA